MIITDDVADELGRSRPDSESDTYRQWQKWIDTTYSRIESYRVRNALPEPEVADLDYVVLMAVATRVSRGGQVDGAQSVTRTVDDGTVTRRYREDGPGVVIDLEPWWDYLWPAHMTGGSESFSIGPDC